MSPIVPVPGPWGPEDKALLDEVRRVREWTDEEQQRTWSELERAFTPRPCRGWTRPLGFALVGAAATAAVVLTVLLRSASGWLQLELGEVGELEVAPGAALRLSDLADPHERRILLDAGALRVPAKPPRPERPVVVQTPHLRAIVVGTRFEVEVGAAVTQVHVSEGIVRVASLVGSAVELRSGMSIGSDDSRLQPPPLDERASMPEPQVPSASRAPVPSVCQGAPKDRMACLESMAAGRGLAAQNALYVLGLTAQEDGDEARAMEAFRRYSERYPTGALGPEASLGLLRSLVSAGEWRQALQESDSFRQRFPTEGRLPAVALLRANLLCRLETDPLAAVAVYEQVLGEQGWAQIRDEALFARAACAEARAGHAAARSHWERYLAELPRGAHAAQARRWLAVP